MEKAKIQAKEDKANALAEAGAAAEEEVEEEEDEAEEIDIGELEEKVKDIETAIAESGNGKLPDEQLNTLVRTFLLSNRCQNQGYILDGYPKTLEQVFNLKKKYINKLISLMLDQSTLQWWRRRRRRSRRGRRRRRWWN